MSALLIYLHPNEASAYDFWSTCIVSVAKTKPAEMAGISDGIKYHGRVYVPDQDGRAKTEHGSDDAYRGAHRGSSAFLVGNFGVRFGSRGKTGMNK